MNHLGRKEDTFWAHSHLRFIVRLPLPLGSTMGCVPSFTTAIAIPIHPERIAIA